MLRLYDFFIYRPFIHSPSIINTEDTIRYIIDSRCSVSRYGDGELNMCWRKHNIHFQQHSDLLRKRLRDILFLKETDGKDLNHIVCIPYVYNDCSHLTIDAKSFWNNLLIKHKFSIIPHLPKKKIYYDSLCTRCYINYADKSRCEELFKLWKKVWNNRKIVMVEGKQSRLGVGNDLFDNAASVERILIPEENAFDFYEDIYESIIQYCEKETLVLLAAGPTATVLAYDLSKIGYQAIDIGHIDIEYSWFKMEAKYKCPVAGKYVNEVRYLGDDTIIDDEYTKSIKCVIKK